jgi:hypothetical protein
MTGDLSHLDLCRSQLDLLWAQRKQVDGVTMVPARHGDVGWFDYRVPDPLYYIHLYYLSQSAEDLARLNEVFPDRSHFRDMPPGFGRGKAGVFQPKPWLAFMEGRDPGYPDRIIDATADVVNGSMDSLDADDSDPEERHCYHFQKLNPVLPEGLVQMAMGTPAALYNGGMLQTHLFYHDPVRRRPGLPEYVAALVDGISNTHANLQLVNTDPVAPHPVLLQAGAFGEHEFTQATVTVAAGVSQQVVGNRHLRVELGPGARVQLKLNMKRFAHTPAYGVPPYDA